MTWHPVVAVAAAAVFLYGGAPAAVAAGGVPAVMVAQDRRSVGAQIDDAAISGETRRKEQAHAGVTRGNGIVLLAGEARAGRARTAGRAERAACIFEYRE